MVINLSTIFAEADPLVTAFKVAAVGIAVPQRVWLVIIPTNRVEDVAMGPPVHGPFFNFFALSASLLSSQFFQSLYALFLRYPGATGTRSARYPLVLGFFCVKFKIMQYHF